MALHTTINHMKDLLNRITQDLSKAEGGNKAASQRVRTNTVRLEKIGKTYRKESINTEKSSKGPRRPAAKKAASKTKSAKPVAKKHTPAAKAKPKTGKAMAKPRAFSLKKPTAKIPVRKSGRR